MKRNQTKAFNIDYTLMENTVSNEMFVEFVPHKWIIPPRNKNVFHKERDVVKFLYPQRLPQQTKHNYIKFVKQAKFDCLSPERNEKWQMKEGRILKMGLGLY